MTTPSPAPTEGSLLEELAEIAADVRSIADAMAGVGVREVAREPGGPGWSVPDRPPAAARPASPTPSSERAPPADRPPSARPPAVRPAPPTAGAPSPGWSLFGTGGDPAARLDALRARALACTACGLAAGRGNVVFGEGAPGAVLMIVGEAPGAEEDASGRPFVGEAGQMLDRMLANVLGLRREQVYIANVLKCRPPRNRDPEAGETAACRAILEEQIAIVRPRFLLALGRHASQVLLDTRAGIQALRGRWGAWKGIPVLPTFHPAYLLREPDRKRDTLEDLRALKRRLDEPG